MRQTHSGETLTLLGACAALAGLAAASDATQWLGVLTNALTSPTATVAAATTGTLTAGLIAARLVVTRRSLGRRVRVHLLPADSFEPADDAVLTFAAGLARTRRPIRGFLDAPASAVRVRLDTDSAGQLRYLLELPAHARGALAVAASAYGGVDLQDADSADIDDDLERLPQAVVARAELVPADASTEPLRAVGIDPDPLAGFARALTGLHDDERAAVCVDLLPVARGERRRLRRRLLRQARHTDRSAGEGLPDALGGLEARGPGPARPVDLVKRRSGQRALTTKLGTPEPLFRVQVLIRASSPQQGRAQARAGALMSAFDPWGGENHFRAVGLRLPGIAFLGADMPWRRGRFDRRYRSGLFRPARRRVVTASEVAGLLKPPTAKCPDPNVMRSGGVIPPPPAGLPTFSGQADLLPLGRIRETDGERMVGVPLADTFFIYSAGRSRFGKTESALGQFLHLARAGHGCFFLDPHEDALTKIKPYLTEAGLRERVVEINLASGLRQPGWNLFATAGRDPDRLPGQVDAVVDAFASALGWDERNTRALNLTTQATQALVELSTRLPAHLAPTLFQVSTLLGNDEWRSAVLPFVSPATRQFFIERFPRLSTEAITPVTNLIDRLRVAPAVAALLGSPISTYDVRAAMDAGQIVLVCPGSGSVRDRLVANLFVYDLLHASKSRADLEPARRRPFYVTLDEVQTYDGAGSGNLAALLEQSAKYGLRATLLNQNPERLSAQTLNAVTTNRSHLLATALNSKAAGLLAREWAGSIEPATITRLERYSFVASVTLAGQVSAPFLLRTSAVDELFPDRAHPDDVPLLEEAIDQNTGRRPVAASLAELDDHDHAILQHLDGLRENRPSASSAHIEVHPTPERDA